MSGAGESRVARRLAAELELERAIHGLMIHELGNPLQSLLVLIELSRDELADAALGEDRLLTPGAEWVARPAERLDRALASIRRLRQVLLSSGRIRARLSDSPGIDHPLDHWGPLLDDFLALVGERLTQLSAGLIRSTEEIDRRPVGPGYVRAATLGLLVGISEQISHARSTGLKDMILELHGEVQGSRTCLRVAVHGPGGPVELAPELSARVDDLLGEDARAGSRREGRSLVIWSSGHGP